MAKSPPNQPTTEHRAKIATRQGWKTVELADAEASAYNADPDRWAAQYFGMTVTDYWAWASRPRCKL